MRIAVIGMGTMGTPMAQNLLKANHQVCVFNRTTTKAEALVNDGATVALSPAEAAAQADVVLVCVSDTADVQDVLTQEQTGVIHTIQPGSLVIDCSSISPRVTRDLGTQFAAKEVGYVDAPVSGGSEGAIHGTLAIMCGGTKEDMARAMPILQVIGKNVTHVGPRGAGQVTKAINQIAIAGTYRAIAEGLVLASRSDIDPKKVVEAICGGAAASWVMDHRSDNMINNEYPLGFRLSLHRKDLNIALEAGKELGVSLRLTKLVAEAKDTLIASGYGDEDMWAIARGVRSESDLPQKPF